MNKLKNLVFSDQNFNLNEMLRIVESLLTRLKKRWIRMNKLKNLVFSNQNFNLNEMLRYTMPSKMKLF